MSDFMIKRVCQISFNGSDFSDLSISFGAPKVEPKYGMFECRVGLECSYFSVTLDSKGQDEAQAFFMLPYIVKGYLNSKIEEGYSVYWLQEGDWDKADFWRYSDHL